MKDPDDKNIYLTVWKQISRTDAGTVNTAFVCAPINADGSPGYIFSSSNTVDILGKNLAFFHEHFQNYPVHIALKQPYEYPLVRHSSKEFTLNQDLTGGEIELFWQHYALTGIPEEEHRRAMKNTPEGTLLAAYSPARPV